MLWRIPFNEKLVPILLSFSSHNLFHLWISSSQNTYSTFHFLAVYGQSWALINVKYKLIILESTKEGINLDFSYSIQWMLVHKSYLEIALSNVLWRGKAQMSFIIGTTDVLDANLLALWKLSGRGWKGLQS